MKEYKYIGMILFFILVGCSPVKMPEINTYAITNVNSITVKSTQTNGVSILVSRPIADPGFETTAMIYMITPYELQAFSRNRWVAPPASMLLPLFVSTIRKTGYFQAVVSAPFSGMTDLVLQTQLVKLQQEFVSPTSQVDLVVQATLFSNRNNRVVASQVFTSIVKASGNNPYAGVIAANRAAQEVSANIARFCLQAMRKS